VRELAEVEVVARAGVMLARVRGEIDLSNVDSTFTTLKRAAAGGADGFVLDLSELSYLDSAGVRLLFTLAHTVTGTGRSVRAVVPRGAHIRRVLELADVEQLIGLDETEDTAVAQLAAGTGNRRDP